MRKSTASTTPTLLTEDEAHRLLEPHMNALRSCIDDAWNKWTMLRDDERFNFLSQPFGPRTRASIVHEYIWEAILKRFDGQPEAHHTSVNGMRVLTLSDQLQLRFKKMDRQFRARNIPTTQQRLFARQEPLPGIPPLTKLTIGYVLNRFQTDVEMVVATLWYKSSLMWHIAMPPGVDETNVTPFMQSEVEMDIPRQRRVKPKRSDDSTGQRAANE